MYIFPAFLYCFSLLFGLVPANITITHSLRDPDVIVSSYSNFELGFFSPFNSTHRYAGIWYNRTNSDELEVIWVANRDNPLDDVSGVLQISMDGALQLLNGQNTTYWSSSVSVNNEVNNLVARLLDTGNLVLVSNSSGDIIWQSFDHPTDTWLPNMPLTFDEKTNKRKQQLVAWKGVLDPSSGRFTAGISLAWISEVFIWDGDRPYWRSGPWNGHVFLGIPVMFYDFAVNGFRLEVDQEDIYSLTFSPGNQTFAQHYRLTSDGEIVHVLWDNGTWIITWRSLNSECDIYGKCGGFGSCNSNNSQICSCLRGFDARKVREWNAGNWISGCVRRTPLQCGTTGAKEDGFLRLKNVKVPDKPYWLEAEDEQTCRNQCLGNCSCLAYAYYLGIGCMVWNGTLIDIQEFSSVGVDLFIRLAHSELDETLSTSRWKIIILSILLVLGAITFAIVIFCFWRQSRQRRGDILEPMMHPSGNDGVISYDRQFLNISDVQLHDLPLLKLEELAVATNNFDDSNKLGR